MKDFPILTYSSWTPGAATLVAAAIGQLPVAAAQEERIYWLGGAFGGELGRAVVSIEDIDGDGIRDLVSGSVLLDPAVRARSGATGKPLWAADVEDYPDFWPMSAHTVTAVGDVDGDGITDLLIGCPSCGFGGTVCLISGRNGAKFWCYTDDEVLNKIGQSTAVAAGDVDGDGVVDIAIGAINDEPPPGVAIHGNLGSVRVLSGATAEELWRTYGPVIPGHFGSGFGMGYSLSAALDFDADGVSEIVVGTLVSSVTTPLGEQVAATVWILNGRSGEVFADLPPPPGSLASRVKALPLPDLTGDGVGELLIGYPIPSAPDGDCVVQILEGLTWNVLFEWLEDNPKMNWGGSMAHIADIDGDGIDEAIVGVHRQMGVVQGSHPAGMVRILSPGTGDILLEIIGTQSGGWHTNFGQTVGSLGDINGDGVEEFFVGAPWWDPSPVGTSQIGRLDVYSAVPRTLSADKSFVFATQGGNQALNLRLGEKHAGDLFLLVGSFAGIHPSLPIDGFELPLVFDGYTATMLASSGGPLVSGWIGTLDSQGQAAATVTIPPLVGPLSLFTGGTVWHTGLTLGATGSVSAVTNAVALSFAP